jgi:hypothetical protein
MFSVGPSVTTTSEHTAWLRLVTVTGSRLRFLHRLRSPYVGMVRGSAEVRQSDLLPARVLANYVRLIPLTHKLSGSPKRRASFSRCAMRGQSSGIA